VHGIAAADAQACPLAADHDPFSNDPGVGRTVDDPDIVSPVWQQEGGDRRRIVTLGAALLSVIDEHDPGALVEGYLQHRALDEGEGHHQRVPDPLHPGLSCYRWLSDYLALVGAWFLILIRRQGIVHGDLEGDVHALPCSEGDAGWIKTGGDASRQIAAGLKRVIH